MQTTPTSASGVQFGRMISTAAQSWRYDQAELVLRSMTIVACLSQPSKHIHLACRHVSSRAFEGSTPILVAARALCFTLLRLYCSVSVSFSLSVTVCHRKATRSTAHHATFAHYRDWPGYTVIFTAGTVLQRHGLWGCQAVWPGSRGRWRHRS